MTQNAIVTQGVNQAVSLPLPEGVSYPAAENGAKLAGLRDVEALRTIGSVLLTPVLGTIVLCALRNAGCREIKRNDGTTTTTIDRDGKIDDEKAILLSYFGGYQEGTPHAVQVESATRRAHYAIAPVLFERAAWGKVALATLDDRIANAAGILDTCRAAFHEEQVVLQNATRRAMAQYVPRAAMVTEADNARRVYLESTIALDTASLAARGEAKAMAFDAPTIDERRALSAAFVATETALLRAKCNALRAASETLDEALRVACDAVIGPMVKEQSDACIARRDAWEAASKDLAYETERAREDRILPANASRRSVLADADFASACRDGDDAARLEAGDVLFFCWRALDGVSTEEAMDRFAGMLVEWHDSDTTDFAIMHSAHYESIRKFFVPMAVAGI